MTLSALATLAISLTPTLFRMTNAHLIMQNPVPFGLDSLNNSPLVDAKPGTSASDYPCKQRAGVYDISVMNNMAVNEPMELSFTGSASHGGGTCQLAVSTDLEPTANSTFKLIQVFEGGCPINADGNSGTHPFTFTIPSGMKNGRLTLAWSWYNRIGNREIYQNCAPIMVTGGSDNDDFYNTLPNQYLINLPTSECSTVEGTDQEIPLPGQFVLKDDTVSIAAATGPACPASAAAMTQGVSGYNSATSSNGAATVAPAKNGDVTGSVTSAAIQTATAASSGFVGSGYSTAASSVALPHGGASGKAAPHPSASAILIIPTAAAVSSQANSAPYPTMVPLSGSGIAAPTGYAAPSGAAPNSTKSSGSTGACSQSGALVCNGASLFGICNDGVAVWRPVAPGTTCHNGQIQKRRTSELVNHARRHARGFSRRHR